MKQTEEMRAASKRHQISMCNSVITRSSVGAVPHTVAMRYMTSSYQCMLQSVFGVLVHPADILSISTSATSIQLEPMNNVRSFETSSVQQYTSHSRITCQPSASVLKQTIKYHSCVDYRTHYGHDGWRYHEGLHADREYDTRNVSTLAPAATSITAQSGCFSYIAHPRAVRPCYSTSFTIRHHTCTSCTTPSAMPGISVTVTTPAGMVNPMTLIGASSRGLGTCSQRSIKNDTCVWRHGIVQHPIEEDHTGTAGALGTHYPAIASCTD